MEHVEAYMGNRKQSILVAVGLTIAVAGWALFGTTGAEAQAEESHCSDRLLRGSYGGSFDGQVPTGGGTLLLRGLVVTHFDGEGNLRQIEYVTTNGAPPPGGAWVSSEGTYEIAPDCTGVAQIVQANGNTLRQRWVVVDKGREIRAIVDGAIAGGTRVRMD